MANVKVKASPHRYSRCIACGDAQRCTQDESSMGEPDVCGAAVYNSSTAVHCCTAVLLCLLQQYVLCTAVVLGKKNVILLYRVEKYDATLEGFGCSWPCGSRTDDQRVDARQPRPYCCTTVALTFNSTGAPARPLMSQPRVENQPRLLTKPTSSSKKT